MNKNLGKKFFSIICVGLIFIGISLFNIGTNKAEVKDLYGKRDELGDISILLQNNKGMYETDKIKIDKDSSTVDYMAKQGMYDFNLSKRNIEVREVLENTGIELTYFSNMLLEDKDKTASVNVTHEYNSSDDIELFANIKVKYIDSDETETYYIPMGKPQNTSMEVFSSVPMNIDKDNIYIAILSGNIKEEALEKGYSDTDYDIYENTVLNLYKVNLSTKKSKHILTKEFNGENIAIGANSSFSNNDKFYFLVKEKDDNKEYYTSSLLEFDVTRKVINTIDLKTTDEVIEKLSIEDDRLLIISRNGSEINNEDTSLKSDNVRATSVNLKKSKVEYIKHINIKTDREYMILQTRRINNKIYAVTREYEEEGKYTGNSYYVISVIDEENNELLYRGELTQKFSFFEQAGIVKDSEI